jgi:hypothetical protein
MGFVVELVGQRALPREAFDAGRDQFHADALLALAHSRLSACSGSEKEEARPPGQASPLPSFPRI